MANGKSGVVVGTVLIVVLLTLALAFGVRQWLDRRRRSDKLTAEDARYFRAQDARRGLGSFVMLLIALAMGWGLMIDPRGDARRGQRFVAVWVLVFALVLLLVALAWLDLWAIRRFARRQRLAILEEGRALAAAQRRPRDPPPTRAHPQDDPNGRPT